MAVPDCAFEMGNVYTLPEENSYTRYALSLIHIFLDSLAFEQQDPEAIVIDRENVNVMQEKIRQHLSRFETRVLDSYLEGMTYTQIAEAMGKSPKSIDNALQRIRGKIREFLE